MLLHYDNILVTTINKIQIITRSCSQSFLCNMSVKQVCAYFFGRLAGDMVENNVRYLLRITLSNLNLGNTTNGNVNLGGY